MATAVEDDVVKTREEEIDALPEFGEVMGLVAVESGITLFMTVCCAAGLICNCLL